MCYTLDAKPGAERTCCRAVTGTQIEPYIRHWVEVTLVGDLTPRFRGYLLWAGNLAITVNGAPPGTGQDDGAAPTPHRQPIRIDRVATITPLADPPWLLEINKAAAVTVAEAFLEWHRGEGS